ncbi:hypothetical protein N8I77_003449 [Diaporthe amygdali]|uniref:Zn(2)-C6 fungal-type domain-containing protein n=1 Tax=Phomopsis amygdali TaxID=1214568 RepID=A0AAD9W5V3_PHOAM|nr:hypothetical protein N8I77_003449 [Diaporthe amygdali]
MPGGKRSQAHDGETQRSRKRERYTRIACESCKTRKVKCSGSLPCSRCVELNANCKYNDYVPQPDTMRVHGAPPRKDYVTGELSEATQHDLGQLLSSMRKICDDIQSSTRRFSSPSHLRSSLKRRQSETVCANLATNTSPVTFVDSLDQARRILEQRGVITVPATNSHAEPDQSDVADTAFPDENPSAALEVARPVLEIGHENALSHLASFRDQLFPVYPCIDLALAKKNIDSLFRTSLLSFADGAQDLGVDLIDIEATKAVLAIGMLIKGDTDSPLSSNLEAHLIWNADNIMKRDHAQIEDVIMGALLTIYFTLRQEVRKAWRVAGLMVQSALEVGLHKERYHRNSNVTAEHSSFLKRLMACVVDLDRRCSFIANLPHHLRDREIDDSVLDLHGRHPLLSAMVDLNIIQAELFELISTTKGETIGYRSKEINDRMDYLDHRIQKLAEETSRVDLFSPDSLVVPPPADRVVLESFFQMRTTYLRMLAHFRSLSSCKALACRPQSAETTIALPKALVELYGKMAHAAGPRGVSQLWGPLADRFIMGSASCMFLAACCNPNAYGPVCRVAFHTAIDYLLASPYTGSGSKPRLWCSLDEMRRLGETIQMPTPDKPTPQALSADSSSDATAVELLDLPQGVEDDIFGAFDATEDNYMAILGMVSTQLDYLSNPI